MLRKLEKKDAPLMLEWMHDPSVVENLNRNFGDLTIEDCEGFIAAAAADAEHFMLKFPEEEMLKAPAGTASGAGISSLHFAIADESDEYMGTVSLKNIDRGASRGEGKAGIEPAGEGEESKFAGESADSQPAGESAEAQLTEESVDSAEFAITIRKCAMGRGISLEAMKEIIRIGYEELGLDIIYWYVSENNKRAVRFYDKNGFKRTTVAELEAKNVKIEDSERQRADLIWYIA